MDDSHMDVRKPFAQCIALSLSGILFLNPIVSVAAGLALSLIHI